MPIHECCNLNIVCCESDTTLASVAELMRRHHVGDVVVTETRGDATVPIGIVTDRDIVVETVAMQLDPGQYTVGDIMSTPVITVSAKDGLVETLRQMRENRVRRIPVVDDTGALAGIVTADDIVRLLAMELSLMTDVMGEQPENEARLRP
ncbi:MAG TPA: CBS domain-containing protein [Noviherbaspirillum sp.]